MSHGTTGVRRNRLSTWLGLGLGLGILGLGLGLDHNPNPNPNGGEGEQVEHRRDKSDHGVVDEDAVAGAALGGGRGTDQLVGGPCACWG